MSEPLQAQEIDPRRDRDPREPEQAPPVEDPETGIPGDPVDDPPDAPPIGEPERRDPPSGEPAWRAAPTPGPSPAERERGAG
jgi:hypothetical protein